MAADFLEGIYIDARVYTKLQIIVEYAQANLVQKIVEELRELIPELESLAVRYVERNAAKGQLFSRKSQNMFDLAEDVVRLADFIKMQVLPELEEYFEMIPPICVDDERGYCLESSKHKFLTICNLGSNMYYHSLYDPMEEARQQIKQLYDPKVSGYAVWGCGLGYQIYQLFMESDGSIMIHVFEQDETMVQYAMDYGVLSWVPEDCLEITIGEDILPFLECAEKFDGAYYIFKPAMQYIMEPYYTMIQSLYIGQCTRCMHERQMLINYYRNTSGKALPVTRLDISSYRKKYIVVAGGPSLDAYMDFLHDNVGEYTIIAVGTVFRKLIRAGIRPDLVTVLDPTRYTCRQLVGLEGESVPLLIATTAYWKWAASYRGEVYLVPVTSHIQEEEEYAMACGMEQWSVGGTVTTLAVRAALKFGAEKIYLLGADFAYPGGVTHASDTDRRDQRDVSNLIPVESVSGGIVYTEANMNMYRNEMEGIISANPQVTFINMSQIGAKIKGTKEME